MHEITRVFISFFKRSFLEPGIIKVIFSTYNVRVDLQEVRCGYMDWIGLAQDRDRWRTLVSAVMNLQVP